VKFSYSAGLKTTGAGRMVAAHRPKTSSILATREYRLSQRLKLSSTSPVISCTLMFISFLLASLTIFVSTPSDPFSH
jgi:hypothetical protein